MTIEMPHSDEATRKSTGKSWEEWREQLDSWGASNKSHTEIVEHIMVSHGLNGWWAQGITIGYERAIGRRDVGQRGDGLYSTSASTTIAASSQTVRAALVNESQRKMWLGEGTVSLRTSSSAKSVRFDDLESGVIIAFYLTAKGESKTSIQVEGVKFLTSDAAETWKTVWKQRLVNLATHLQS